MARLLDNIKKSIPKTAYEVSNTDLINIMIIEIAEINSNLLLLVRFIKIILSEFNNIIIDRNTKNNAPIKPAEAYVYKIPLDAD